MLSLGKIIGNRAEKRRRKALVAKALREVDRDLSEIRGVIRRAEGLGDAKLVADAKAALAEGERQRCEALALIRGDVPQ